MIKKCLLSLKYNIKTLRLEAPVPQDSDKSLINLISAFKKLEMLQLNLNTQISPDKPLHPPKVRNLKLCDSLWFLSILDVTGFKYIESLSILALEIYNGVSLVNILEKVLSMRNLSNLEIFYFP